MTGILDCFASLTLTADQRAAALQIEAFLAGTDPVFLLKGYAGTGKTTLLKGICQYVQSQGREPLLMAPTGRAAKVMREKTGLAARTIHKHIYSFTKLDTIETTDGPGEETYRFYFKLSVKDELYRQVILVDEASMVSDAESEGEFYRFGTGRLLRDLLAYGKIGQANVRTQIIFVGDPAQLPPVGMASSPALDAQYMADVFGLPCHTAELRGVVRQNATSGVLALATEVRHCIEAGQFNHFCVADNGTDVRTLAWAEFMPAYLQADPRKVVVCYKNKTAKDINERIRGERFGASPPPLVKGDVVVVGMNNRRLDVMNGTFGQITEVTGRVAERAYTIRRKTGTVSGTLRWRWAGIRFRDEGLPHTAETWILENFLLSDGSRLDSVESQALYVDFVIRYGSQEGRESGFTKTVEFQEALKGDDFFNALMVKHGYAVTCHKAQGSEWPDVLVCFDYNTTAGFNPYRDKQTVKGLDNSEFYRWAYTAITRASGRLLALNPPRLSAFSKLEWDNPATPEPPPGLPGAEIRTLPWGGAEDAWLRELSLAQRCEPIQRKLLEVRHGLAPAGVRLQTAVSKPYQEHLVFERNGKTARALLTYGGDFVFKHQIQGGDEVMAALLRDVMARPAAVVFERQSPLQVTFLSGYQPPADRPQLAILFESVSQLAAAKQISIIGIDSLPYRERYTFRRGAEEATADFVYTDKGFFRKAGPVHRKSRGGKLLADIGQIIGCLKRQEPEPVSGPTGNR